MSDKEEKRLLPFETIKAATEGDILAVNEVLMYYEGYINKLSKRKIYDECGGVHYIVDETLRNRLKARLLQTVLKFKLVR